MSLLTLHPESITWKGPTGKDFAVTENQGEVVTAYDSKTTVNPVVTWASGGSVNPLSNLKWNPTPTFDTICFGFDIRWYALPITNLPEGTRKVKRKVGTKDFAKAHVFVPGGVRIFHLMLNADGASLSLTHEQGGQVSESQIGKRKAESGNLT